MRRFALLLLALYGAGTVAAQAPLGPRLGDEISRAERDYFGLFPRLGSSFESARVAARDSLVMVVAARRGMPDTTVVLDAPTAAAMAHFTETFEQAEAAFLNPHWQEASGGGPGGTRLDASVTPLYVNPSETTVLTVAGRRLQGVVLHASDSLLLLHPARPYQWNAPAVARLRPSDIQRVEIRRRETERTGPLVQIGGALAGLAASSLTLFAADGSTFVPAAVAFTTLGWAGASLLATGPPPPGAYTERLGALQARAAFQTRFPLDFRPADAPPAVFARGTARSSSMAMRLARWRQAYGWINVSVLGGASGRFQGAGEYTVFVQGATPSTRVRQTDFGSAVPEVGLDIALRPVPFVRVGGTWMRSERRVPELVQVARGSVEPSTLRAYAEAVLPTPRIGGFGLEVSAGAGLELVENVVDVPVPSGGPPARFSAPGRGTGRFYQGTLDLVLPQRASLFVRLTSRSLPSIDVPGVEAFNPQTPTVVSFRRDPYTASFGSYREVTWGTRFRF